MKVRNWPLYALGGIFITPFIVAAIVLSNTPKFKTTQRGTFIDPTPVHLDQLSDLSGQVIDAADLKNKWRVIYNQSATCNTECIAEKQLLSNVHKALGKERSRVIFGSGNLPNLNSAIGARIYIVDPIDHCIMYYTAENKAQDLLKDLKRLLKYSHAY